MTKQDFLMILVKKLDVITAVIGIFIGIIFLVLAFCISGRFLFSSFRLPFISILILSSCVIYLKLRRKCLEVPEQAAMVYSDSYKNKSIFYTLTGLFFVLFAYSLLILKSALYIRPLGYFVATILMCAIIATEIFMLPKSNKNHICLILIEIIIIGISLRASIYFEFPGFVGIDPWFHTWFSNLLLTLGHVPSPLYSDYYYSYFPILHILNAETSTLTGLNLKTSLMMSIGIFEVISLVFIFIIGKHYFDSKVGLFSALLVSINYHHIVWGYWIIPMTLGLGLTPLIFYLLIIKSKQHNKKSMIFTILSLLVLITIILTHTVTSIIILIIFFLIYAGDAIYCAIQKNKTFVSPISLTFLVLFLASLLAYWIYVSQFFDTAILRGMRNVYMLDENIVKCLPQRYGESLLDWIGFFFFYLLAIVGSLYILNRNIQNRGRFALIVTGWFLAAFVFIMPLYLRNAIVPARWFAFVEIILSIPAAVGLTLACHHKDIKNSFVSIILIILVTSAGMVTNSNVNPDGSMQSIKEYNVRYGLTYSEIQSTQTVSEKYEGPIGTDVLPWLSLTYILNRTANIISQELIDKDYGAISTEIILIRDYIIEKPFSSGVTVELKDDPREDFNILGYSRIYDCDTVYGYYITKRNFHDPQGGHP